MTIRISAALTAVAASFLITNASLADEPVSLERALVRVAPAVIEHCKQNGYQNVGVLKFLVINGEQGKLSDNAGTINLTVARQLETALILSIKPSQAIGIIENASAVAAKTPGANHLTHQGRLKLFEARYPLAWGKEKVAADAFITGTVGISSDLKTLAIQLMCFDNKSNTLRRIGEAITTKNNAARLAEMGESFSTRGAFDGGDVVQKNAGDRQNQEEKILQTAARVKDKQSQTPHPLNGSGEPVRLEVHYDGRKVPFEFRDGKAFVPEPRAGQSVILRLVHNKWPAEQLGCVLKVNGENTLNRQRLPDPQCRCWLLDPDDVSIIKGFQIDDKNVQAFRVLSAAESKANEMNYGADVGTITLSVFRARTGRRPTPGLIVEDQYTQIVEQMPQLKDKPNNFAALTAQLIAHANGNRGIIEGGKSEKNEIAIHKFEPDPMPIMSVTVVYYKP